MRLELAPFGVKVTTVRPPPALAYKFANARKREANTEHKKVVAGTVATNLVKNQAPSKLPAGT